MKKMLFLMVALFCLLSATQAEVKYSIKAGGGLLYGKDVMLNELYAEFVFFPPPGVKASSGWDQFMKTEFGFIGGFSAEYPLNEYFSLQAEILYSPKQFTIDADCFMNDPSTGLKVLASLNNVELNIHYLDVPVLAKFYATEKLSFIGGVSMAIAVSHDFSNKLTRQTFTSSGELDSEVVIWDYSGELDDQISASVFNMHLGAQYNIGKKMFVEFRYIRSLSPAESYKGVSVEEYDTALGLPTEELRNWLAQHPFGYINEQNGWMNEAGSINLDALHILVGYTF